MSPGEDKLFLEFFNKFHKKKCDCGGQWTIASPASVSWDDKEEIILGIPVFTQKEETSVEHDGKIQPQLVLLCLNCGAERFYRLSIVKQRFKEYQETLAKATEEDNNG
jgi:hypothetical protein